MRLSKIGSGFLSNNNHEPIVYEDFSVYERFTNARPLTIAYPLFHLLARTVMLLKAGSWQFSPIIVLSLLAIFQ
jgi:hypothetical protein